MKTHFSKVLFLTALFGVSLISFSVLAVPPHTPGLTTGAPVGATWHEWEVRAYNDRSPTHRYMARQTICFRYVGTVGTHDSYEWYSNSYFNWNGRATQEGDQISMHGDFWNEVGHDGMTWQLTTQENAANSKLLEQGAGHWYEWIENAALGWSVGFANTLWTKTGKKCEDPATHRFQSAAVEDQEYISPQNIDRRNIEK
ncbi:hypothetical protein [Aliikangiella coralliicola]|uniref:Uncharacterized protein n=1 Tax=Aliikangiella coralliicola TaxID=2592383 RepID=A0A545UH70_9GAMM|nr:hypothetical protein [Aliikangiella coralliicola]TQV88763.1 hypothetical protein FLL46_04320 [Aliikangiella coralliicola]